MRAVKYLASVLAINVLLSACSPALAFRHSKNNAKRDQSTQDAQDKTPALTPEQLKEYQEIKKQINPLRALKGVKCIDTFFCPITPDKCVTDVIDKKLRDAGFKVIDGSKPESIDWFSAYGAGYPYPCTLRLEFWLFKHPFRKFDVLTRTGLSDSVSLKRDNSVEILADIWDSQQDQTSCTGPHLKRELTRMFSNQVDEFIKAWKEQNSPPPVASPQVQSIPSTNPTR